MMARGYVKLYRKIRESEIWKTAEGRLAVTELFLEVAHESHEFTHAATGTVVKVERGMCVISVRQFAEQALISYQNMRSVLAFMEREKMAELAIIGSGKNRVTSVKLLNYERYNPTQSVTQSLTQSNAPKIDANRIVPTQSVTQSLTHALEVKKETIQVNGLVQAAKGVQLEPTETDRVKRDRAQIAIWLKDMPLYRDDKQLNAVDPQTGRVYFAQSMETWRFATPADRMDVLKRAYSWEIDNPKKRKKNKLRFLGNWMRSKIDENMKAAPQPKFTPLPRSGKSEGLVSVAGLVQNLIGGAGGKT